MADFEELKLSVNLDDRASAGLTAIRTQITQLVQAAGQVSGAFDKVGTSVQQVGIHAQQAAPKLSSAEKSLKELNRSAEETGRGLIQMALNARRGMEAFPELALSFRETTQGLKGMSAAMAELSPTSRLAVVGLTGVVVGITAVGAAVAAYGISVFKFGQEMYQLSQTSRALGITFGTLKTITDQNAAFGISVENTTAQLARMQEALTDLSLSGSKLRQSLIGQGAPAGWIDAYIKETDEIKRANMVREGQLKIMEDMLRRGLDPAAARGVANRFALQLGRDPTAMDRPALEAPTAHELENLKKVEESSQRIGIYWAEIRKKIGDIKDDFLSWGLPSIERNLRNLKQGLGIETPKEHQEFLHQRGLEVPEADEDMSWAGRRDRLLRRLGKPGYKPTSFEGTSGNPLLHRTGFGDSDLGGSAGEGRAQAIIKAGVYEALVDFNMYLRTGGTGGGGFQNAALTTGGGGGGGGFRSGGGYSVLPNGSDVGPGTGAGAGASGRSGGGIPSDADLNAKDRSWYGGANVGGKVPGGSVGGGGGGGDAGGGGDTSKVGNEFLASQRERMKKEMDDDPELKRRFAAIIQTENPGAGTAVAESALNRAAMTGRSLRSILSGGPRSFYGPARRGQIEPTMRNMSARDLAARYRQIDEATSGSNVIKGHTDQGSAGDPNYIKGGVGVNINRERFNDWGGFKGVEHSRRWRESQQDQVNRSAVEAKANAEKSASDTRKSDSLGPMTERYSHRSLQGSGFDLEGGGRGGSDREGNAPLTRVPIYTGGDRSDIDLDRPVLNRSALSRSQSEITSRGSLSVDVTAPPGTKVAYSGDNLLRQTSMQRQTQMMPTDIGPSSGDTERSYMRGSS